MSVATKKPSANGKSTTAEKVIALPKLNIEVMRVRLVGDSPLICHKWSEKAKEEMRAKQFKLAKVAKAAKDPEADFRGSLYEHPGGGYGFPAIAFKSAAVDACSHVDGITKVEARGAFHISEQFGPNVTDLRSAELVRIEGEPTMREDMVRVGMGTADLRYRGEILIHAAQTFDQDGYNWVRETFPEIPMPQPSEFERGGIIGAANLWDVATASSSPWFNGPLGFCLSGAEPLPFVAIPGRLGFFDAVLPEVAA